VGHHLAGNVHQTAAQRRGERRDRHHRLAHVFLERLEQEEAKEHGMSSATFYKWRAKYGGMDASLMARMKELERENRQLKKMYAEERLKAEIVKEALEKKW